MSQHLFFHSDYFSNNDNGCENPYTLSTDLFDVRIYCNKLTSEQLDEVKSYFSGLVESFSRFIPKWLLKLSSKEPFEVYVFEDLAEHKKVEGTPFKKLEGFLGIINFWNSNLQPKKLKGYRWIVNSGNLNFYPKKYFINGGGGYENPYTIDLQDYNMEITCYYNKATPEQLQKIKEIIQAIFKKFFEKIPEAINSSKNLETIKINIFNNKEDCPCAGFNELECITMELTAPAYFGYLDSSQRGPGDPQTEITISDPNNLKSLRHELAHALTFYTLGSAFKFVPKFLIEGIAEYFADESELSVLTTEEIAGLTLQKLKELYCKKNDDKTRLFYRTGHFLVNYLQAEHPGLINQYFTDLRNCKLEKKDLPYPVRKFIDIFDIKMKDDRWLLKKYVDNREIKKFKSKIASIMSVLEKPKDREEWLLNYIKEPSTILEPYFINGGKGYQKPTTIKLEDSKLEIIYYYNKLTVEQLQAIDKTIPLLCKDFYEKLPSARNFGEEPERIEINFFNNEEDYLRIMRAALGESREGSGGLSIEEGITQENGPSKVIKKLYIANPSNLRYLRHELTHGLVSVATGTYGQTIPWFLAEGIATHFENEAKSNLSMLTPEESAVLTLERVKDLEWADRGKDRLNYRIAHSMVNYLQAKFPGLIDQYLVNLRNCTKELTEEDLTPSFTVSTIVLYGISRFFKRFFPESIAKIFSNFEEKRIGLWYRDIMFRRGDNKLEPIMSVLGNSRDTEEWLLQHREQPSTDKGDDIYSAVVQQMAGDESPSTSLSSLPIVADSKGSKVSMDEIVSSGRY